MIKDTFQRKKWKWWTHKMCEIWRELVQMTVSFQNTKNNMNCFVETI